MSIATNRWDRTRSGVNQLDQIELFQVNPYHRTKSPRPLSFNPKCTYKKATPLMNFSCEPRIAQEKPILDLGLRERALETTFGLGPPFSKPSGPVKCQPQSLPSLFNEAAWLGERLEKWSELRGHLRGLRKTWWAGAKWDFNFRSKQWKA